MRWSVVAHVVSDCPTHDVPERPAEQLPHFAHDHDYVQLPQLALYSSLTRAKITIWSHFFTFTAEGPQDPSGRPRGRFEMVNEDEDYPDPLRLSRLRMNVPLAALRGLHLCIDRRSEKDFGWEAALGSRHA